MIEPQNLNLFPKSSRIVRHSVMAFSLGIITAIAISQLSWKLPAAIAQNLRPEMVATQIYAKLQDLPQENQYISQETGQIAAENTLISRLIRYHEYVKGRPVIYRLDWKLTLADYLGVNEIIQPSEYPGKTTLKTNPLSGDKAAIKSLTYTQRNALVDNLIGIYNPEDSSTPDIKPSPTNSNTNTNTNDSPIPERGGADLLLP